MTRRHLVWPAAVVAVLALGACSHTPAAGGTAAPSVTPSGISSSTVQQMQQQVDAAQSAAVAADSDAANDPN
ncbi:hypothetical protein ABUW04_08455 [Streptacidiphilus sp. N1-10]|uniref:Lipoprotein n=1 Tax=Streptacidiphilus jeojiensis TaxID=3229225 RepID=A0ABV6XJ54_9ACTN